jgi:hypothetical protein
VDYVCREIHGLGPVQSYGGILYLNARRTLVIERLIGIPATFPYFILSDVIYQVAGTSFKGRYESAPRDPIHLVGEPVEGRPNAWRMPGFPSSVPGISLLDPALRLDVLPTFPLVEAGDIVEFHHRFEAPMFYENPVSALCVPWGSKP